MSEVCGTQLHEGRQQDPRCIGIDQGDADV